MSAVAVHPSRHPLSTPTSPQRGSHGNGAYCKGCLGIRLARPSVWCGAGLACVALLAVNAPWLCWVVLAPSLVAAGGCVGPGRRLALVLMGILGLGVWHLLHRFEMSPEPWSYSYPLPAARDAAIFLAWDPKEQHSDILLHLNAIKNPSSTLVDSRTADNSRQGAPIAPPRTAPILTMLNVTGGTIWNTDPLHFDFLLHYWSTPSLASPWACILEGDMVVNATYVREKFFEASPGGYDIMWGQHMWGHRWFERNNYGILCSRKEPQSLWNRFLVHAMRWILSRRTRRLVGSLMVEWLFTRSSVLRWDEDGGCTLWENRCNYIHFTRPAKLRIALDAVRRATDPSGEYALSGHWVVDEEENYGRPYDQTILSWEKW